MSNSPWTRTLAILFALTALCASGLAGCRREPEKPLLPRSQTWAELRTVRRAVVVQPPGEKERPPYPRERLVDGEVVKLDAAGLAWLRRDGGATFLIRGPAELKLRADALEIVEGRLFVDTPPGVTAEILTPNGPVYLAQVRASIDVSRSARTTEAYVLAGEVRARGEARAGAGEKLRLSGAPEAPAAATEPALAWEDWTGGLATTDRAAEPSPFGVGTVGARRPGDQGAPRFPLAIQQLAVRVSIEGDFAMTEVDEVFFNPSSEVVEGVYRFRTPDGAVLSRFGVDREGVVVWGRVKEKEAAATQYQQNVYAGSKEDPALLEWDAVGVYRARLYPIGPGETRRVVVRYAEWLGRTGEKGERRLYVYPMAAEGHESSLPHVEELTATIDLSAAGASEVRVGMAAARDGDLLRVREHDFVPRADLAVELFDAGHASIQGITAKHSIDLESLPPAERGPAIERARTEADYVLVPVRATDVPLVKGGLDLVIVVDASAATGAAELLVARAAVSALLTHLGPDDRALVLLGDTDLRPVARGWDTLRAVDDSARKDLASALAHIERGGATDLGAMLARAAGSLDPARRGALVYVGDGAPTVGELGLLDLRERLGKLPRPVRLFALGVGDTANMHVLGGLARGALAERISDGNAAARAALRLLELAERPAWLGAGVDLGPTVERVFPRELGAVTADETVLFVGRFTGEGRPTSVTLSAAGEKSTVPLELRAFDDQGDLRRRWAHERLGQMLDESSGRAAMVDLGSRSGIVTPVTSLYVPTKNEMSHEELADLSRRQEDKRKQQQGPRTRKPEPRRPGFFEKFARSTDEGEQADEPYAQTVESMDNKEGGTGTRARGEEGSMGNPRERASKNRYGVQGPSRGAAASPAPMAPPPAAAASAAPPADAEKLAEPKPSADPGIVRQEALKDAAEFGMIGILPSAPAEPSAEAPSGNVWGGEIGDSFGAGGPGLSGVGSGGGGKGDGVGLGDIGTIGQGAPPTTGTGQGFGSGHGRLGGAHSSKPSSLKMGRMIVHGRDDEGGRDASQAEGKKSSESSTTTIVVQIGDLPRMPRPCSAAAGLPLEERAALWRERLARVNGNPHGVAGVYRTALAGCEAPTPRERSRLLSMLLDALSSVPSRVQLWRIMHREMGAGDALYRGILGRIRTPDEARQLHQALGLKSVDKSVLEKLLGEARSPAERVTRLRALVAEWPDDMTLALLLLDGLEDAGDLAGARELCRTLRARPDADARLRTAVGELHLRLSRRASSPEEKDADELEARRAFGEIVEFSPDDPVARRRLGDLLRANGYFADAARQYETLARLAPDDPSVALLLAAAAEGLGKLEEAVKWTEKGGAAGAPDSPDGIARTSQALAATYLAWGRLSARAAGRAEELSQLQGRIVRVMASERRTGGAAGSARATLTWAHPELHPSLWSDALGAPMPAPEGDVTLGIAQVILPSRETTLEVRLDPEDLEHAARLGAEAILTVIFDEGGEAEAIVKQPVRFARGGPPTRRFAVSGRRLQEVVR